MYKRQLRGAAFTRPEVQGGQRRDQERNGSGLNVEPFHTLYLDTFGVALFAAAVIFLLRRGGFLLSLLERLFHNLDVGSLLQQVGGERMAQQVRINPFRDSRFPEMCIRDRCSIAFRFKQ